MLKQFYSTNSAHTLTYFIPLVLRNLHKRNKTSFTIIVRILVIEEYEHAVNRGAKIYCEIVGYGSNCDAHHITAPLEDGSGAARCMEIALKDGNVNPNEVVYINAHGTSTPLNDKGETKIIEF